MANLYVIATPIGNLGDISARALELLKDCDLVIAEDTRHSLKLMNHFDIHKPMTPCHKFNEYEKAQSLAHRIATEQLNAALISDAGTPAISDPGHRLVAAAWAEGILVFGVPGPSALVTALSVSGFDATSFTFHGFAPRQPQKRESLWQEIAQAGITVHALYESPLRIVDLLASLATVFPDALCCVCCDLTKKFERSLRGTVTDVYELLRNDAKAALGEYVIVLDKGEFAAPETTKTEMLLESRLLDCMLRQSCGLREAQAALIESGEKKNPVYQAALRLKAFFEEGIQNI